MEIYYEDFSIEETVCSDCKHRFFRMIKPLHPEDYMSSEALEELSADENGIIIEQNTCLILDDDIVDIIIECSHYERKNSFLGTFPV